MISKRLFIFLFCLISIANAFAQHTLPKYQGESKRKIVIAEIGDSTAIIEYCHSGISGIWNTDYDTLKRTGNRYTHKRYEIWEEGGQFLFKPGDIKLTQGLYDSFFNQAVNQGYTNYLDRKIKRALTWTGADLSEYTSNKWIQLASLNPVLFKEKANAVYDSLQAYYTSAEYIKRFSKLIIRDYRIIPKRYVITTNQDEIFKIWRFLSQTEGRDRNILPFLIQYLIPVATVSIFDFEVALLASPFTYPALIATEIFVGNRINSGNTFKLIFYENGKRQNVLKIRRNKIICGNYMYNLPDDFKQALSTNKNGNR